MIKYNMTMTALAVALLVGTIGTARAVSIEPAAEYDPQITPADFSTTITNPYFTLPIGKKMVYTAQTEDGVERIEVLVPGWTREVMGVQTLVFWDRVYLDGELIEDTRDYLAQHKNGDIWYFGEHVDNYEKGAIKDHAGAWIAGVDGAKPGIWTLANPQVGDEFRNEYYAGEAEDVTKILGVDESVEVKAGTYTDCVKTLDWSPLSSQTANKYFCQPVGGTVLEVELPGPDRAVEQRAELVEVDMQGALNTALPDAYAKEGVVGAASMNDKTKGGDEDKKITTLRLEQSSGSWD